MLIGIKYNEVFEIFICIALTVDKEIYVYGFNNMYRNTNFDGVICAKGQNL